MSRILFSFLLLLNVFAFSQTTIISNNDVWKYKDDGSNQGTAWISNTFNDASWASGPGQLGYGDGDEATILNACGTVTQFPSCSNKYIGYYFRKQFNIPNVNAFGSYKFNLLRDDGIVIYINGVEVYRDNMPTGTIAYNTPAATACSDDGLTMLTFSISASSGILVNGLNTIAVEVHQNIGTSSDLTFQIEMLGTILSQTTFISNSDVWKYKDDGSNQGTAWTSSSFNDASWASGPGQFGYGDGDEATILNACGTVSQFPACTNKYIGYYFRKQFNITNINDFNTFKFNMLRDDGVVVYLNGTEVYRNNMPAGTISYNTPAPAACSDDGLTIQTFSITPSSGYLVNGVNTIAVEIHQNAGNSSDLTFQLELIGASGFSLVRGPYLQQVTSSTINIRWRTDVAVTSSVKFGVDSNALNDSVNVSGMRTEHEVKLTGLLPYTKYYYSIGSTTTVVQKSTANNFKTSPLPGTEGKYTFLVSGDCGNNSTNQKNSRDRYLNYIGNNTTNGWLLLGDNAYSSGTDAEFQSNFYDLYQNNIMKNAPLWPTPGNHDYSNGSAARQNDHNVPYYDMFTLPKLGEAGGVASNTEAFYSYDYGNIHFLSLDSYGKENNSTRLYDTTGAQVNWIKQDLTANTKPWVVAYWHHPPYTMGSHNSDNEGELASVRTNFIRILERYGVDLIMCGHSHDYERSKLMKGHYGNEASFNPLVHNLSSSSGKYDGSANSCTYLKDSMHNTLEGTVYVVSGSAGQLGGTQGSFPHAAMQYSDATNGGSFILEFDGNRLDAKFLCADGNIRDKFTMIKNSSKVKNYTINFCDSINLTASWNGQYVWSQSVNTKSVTVKPTVSKTYIVTDQFQCVSDTFNITVINTLNPIITPNAPGTNQVCINSVFNYSVVTTIGRSYSWSVTGGTIISGQGTGVVTIAWDGTAGSGQVGITETIIAGSCSVSSVYSVTKVTPSSVAAPAGATNVCSSVGTSSPISYNYSISIITGRTYTWSVTGGTITGASSGIDLDNVNVLWATATTGSVSVTETNPITKCTTAGATLSGITINVLPSAIISGSSSVCLNSGKYYSLSNITGGTVTSYLWSVTGGTIINGQGTSGINVNWTSTGVNTIICHLTGTSGCVGMIPAFMVTVNSNLSTSFSGSTTVCPGMPYRYTAASSGNTYGWTANGGVITSQSGNTVTIVWSNSSNASLTLNETAANSCTGVSSTAVTVNGPVTATAINGPSQGCVNNSQTYSLSGTSATSWSVTGGSIVSSGANTANINWATSGSQTITANYSNGSCNYSVTLTVNINPLPAPVVSGTSAVCTGNTYTYSTASIPGRTYNWNVPLGNIASGQGTNVITVSWNNTGTTTVSVNENITATGCNASSSNFAVTVNAMPSASITGNTTVCNGGTYTYTAPAAATYIWAATGGTISGSTSSQTVSIIWGSGNNGSMALTTGNGSCTSYNTLPVMINTTPSPIITGDNAICSGASNTYSTPFNSNYTYNWTVTNASYTFGGNNNTISVIPNTGATTITTAVSALLNGTTCTGNASKTVTVNITPAITITGNLVACQNATQTYSVSGASTYIFTATGGTVMSSTSNTITIKWGAVNGSVNITGTTAAGCIVFRSFPISVNSLPSTTVMGPNSVCANNTYNYSSSNQPGATYLWTVTGGNIYGSNRGNTSTIIWGNTGAGSLKLEVTSAAGCTDTKTIGVTINAQPAPVITGATTACENITQTYSVTAMAGNAYNWKVTGGYITKGAGTNSIDIFWTSKGTGTISVSQSTGLCMASSSLNIPVNAAPPIPSVYKAGNTLTTDAIGSYQWYNNGTALPGRTASSLVVSTAGKYTLSVTNTFGCGTMSNEVLMNTGINKNNTTSGLKVYPNPTYDLVTIKSSLDKVQNVAVKVFDIHGRLLMDQTIENGDIIFTKTINLQGFASGVYIIELITNEGTSRCPIVKE